MVIFGINTTSDMSKLLYVISRAVRRVIFETILKYHKWYLCQISRTNHAIICLYYYVQKVYNFTCRYFKLSWNTTALSQSNCRNFWCGSIIGLNTANDISKLLYVKFETILKYHEWYWYWCQIAPTNHAFICLYYYSQKVL